MLREVAAVPPVFVQTVEFHPAPSDVTPLLGTHVRDCGVGANNQLQRVDWSVDLLFVVMWPPRS